MAKKRRAPPPAKAPAPRPAPKGPARETHGGVTLWGEIVETEEKHIHFAVANTGDAKQLGLCGTHVFAKRQIVKQGRVDGYDWIRVPYALVSLKATRCQPCD